MDAEELSSEVPVPEEEKPQVEPVDELSLLKEQLEETLREKDQFRGIAQRAQADLMNYKKRATEEMADVRRTTSSRSILTLLSIVDDLDRAISLIPNDAVVPGWLDGLNLVMRNITSELDLEGVSKIDVLGKIFEPWECEAVQYKETEGVEEGEVIEVIRDGYRHHNKVLRAAQVIVAKKPDLVPESDIIEEEVT